MITTRHNVLKFLFCLCFFGFGKEALTQIDYDQVPNPTNAYFINDAYIHENPQKQVYLGDIIIRNGIIEKIGKSLQQPFDAERILADSLHVYAGFIDVLNHGGLVKMEKPESPTVKFPGMPPDDVAGITPQRKTIDYYNPESKDFNALRKAGICIANISLSEGMMAGKTTIIQLNGAKRASISENQGLFSQFKGARRMYPSTVIGVIAKWKDLYKQAENEKKYRELYKINNSGLLSPDGSATLEGLFGVIDKSEKVFFKANSRKNVFRANDLRKDLNVKMVLVDVPDVSPIIDYVEFNNVEWAFKPTFPDTSKLVLDSVRFENDVEYKQLFSRQKEALEKAKKSMSIIEKKNIPFAFSLMDMDVSMLQSNILQMISNGLSPSMAYAALTVNPSKILGIEKICGSLAPGKLANIYITDKEFFKEKSSGRFSFVGGTLFSFEKEEKASGNTSNIVGEWNYSVDTGDGQRKGEIKIEPEEKGLYTITLTSDDDPSNPNIIRGVKPAGNKVKFEFNMTEDGYNVPVTIESVFEKTSFEGTVGFGDFGSFPIKGKRIKKPE